MLRHVLLRIRQSLFQASRKKHSSIGRRRGKNSATLGAEYLESRQLLSANQVHFDAAQSQIVVEGGSTADSVVVSSPTPGLVSVRAEWNGTVVQKDFQRAAVNSILFIGGGADDRFGNMTDISSFAYGEGGNDTLIGGNASDQLFGGVGNDVLLGGAGNDQLRGEDGNDHLEGSAGNDELIGGLGDDQIYGGAGDDVGIGGSGHDSMHGGDGNDTLYGEAGNDRLHGESGNDNLYGGTDNDSLTGGDGNDKLYGEDGDDILDGAAGNDEADGGIGSDRLYGGVDDDVLVGGFGNDYLFGGDGSDALYGTAGEDRLFGEQGDDDLQGGLGNDSLVGGDGADKLYGQEGNDYLSGLVGSDQLDGGVGDDRVYGSDGDDLLIGGDGNDTLFAGDGDDTLNGASGDDRLFGESGDDMLYGGWGRDSLYGGTHGDRLYGEEGNDFLDGLSGDDELNGGIGDDQLFGGVGIDLLIGAEGNDTLYGGEGNDTLNGAVGNDLLFGDIGDDTLFGSWGDDLLHGGGGADKLYGEEGNDHIDGAAGDDQIEDGDGDNNLYGGAGNDLIIGGIGNDSLFGGDGIDTLNGGIGDDLLFGGNGDDSMLGSGGNDALIGEAGRDILHGEEGNDVLVGGDGQDHLDGLDGDDILIGGRTAFDAAPTGLRALLSVWAGPLPYASRIQQIGAELFQARLESLATVFDDGIADTVFGRMGQDWLFQTGAFEFYSPLAHHHGSHDSASTHLHPGPTIIGVLPALEGFELIDSLDEFQDAASNEQIHSKLPHSDNPAFQREHLALFQLVRYDQVTHVAMASGNWSDPSIWQNGVVPANGARVLIPVDAAVTIDRDIAARVATVRVDGTLKFSTTANSELRADTVVVSTTGNFEMGTAGQPIAAGVRARLLITDNGAIDRTRDPYGISRGLISHGSVTIHGTQVSSQGSVAGPVSAGTNLLLLTAIPVGWKAGDTIVLAGTSNAAEQNETRRIVSVIGTTVILDRPLEFHHALPNASPIHLAHLTRNAVIESESEAVDRRGHVMFMHSRNVHISYAGFYTLGRTDKSQVINDPVVNADWTLKPGTGANPRARYSVHFHRNGLVKDGNPSTVVGSAVVDSGGWGYVNHSSYVDFVDNVAFGVNGAAFVTEVGDEIGSFYRNLAIGTTGSGEDFESRMALQDFGHQGDGFWFQGAGINVTNNVSAGNEGSAFAYYTRGLVEGGIERQFVSANLPDPSIANGAASIRVSHVPVLAFAFNTGYASSTGLSAWYQLVDATHSVQSVFANSKFWNNTQGIDLSYSQQAKLQNLDVTHTFGDWPMLGIDSNLVTKDIVYENLSVAGYTWGIRVPAGDSIVNGGYFNNIYDIVVPTVFYDRTVRITGAIQFGELPISERKRENFNVLLHHVFMPIYSNYDHVFRTSRVILDYGTFSNQQLYSQTQRASYIPFPTVAPNVPSQYVGKSNQQLFDQFGITIGGALAPGSASSIPISNGLLAPFGGI